MRGSLLDVWYRRALEAELERDTALARVAKLEAALRLTIAELEFASEAHNELAETFYQTAKRARVAMEVTR